MKKINLIRFILIIALFASGSIFASGGSRNGTAGATELLIPVGARGIAMSGSTLVNSTGVEALYWNPANLSRSDFGTNVMFSHMNYIADIGVEYGAISTNVEGFGALAFSLKSLNIGSIPITSVDHPDGTGQSFTPSFVTMGLTYSRLLSDRISVGVTVNLISERLDLVSTTGFAFNVGISYKNLGNINGLSFAVVLKNLGPQMKYDGSGLNILASSTSLDRTPQYYKIDAAGFELPSTLEIGLGYAYNINANNQLMVNGVFQNSNFYGDEYKGGLEYSYNKLFFVRAGYDYVQLDNTQDSIYGPSAGVGLDYVVGGFDLKVDYAWRGVKYFGANHIISVTLGF